MKIWRVSAASVAVLTISACALLAKADWEHKIEELQVLNQVNHEEIDILLYEEVSVLQTFYK